MPNTLRNLTSFKRNLELQLEDLELERTNRSIELYFDASDMYQTLLGFEAFYIPSLGFDIGKFNDKRALVHSLSASGWIGEFQLLPPHLSEFFSCLNIHFAVGIEKDPKGRARQFVEDIGVFDTAEFKKVYFEHSRSEELYDFIKQQAGFAETLFKTFQCIIPWHKRFMKLQSANLLKVSEPELHYDQLAQSEYFQRLYHNFQRKRPQTPQNNTADALAVTILVDMVRNYKIGVSKVVPRFLVPSPLFEEVVRESQVWDLLSYPAPNGTASSAFRDSDYYIFKASFRKRFLGVESLGEDNACEQYLRVLDARITSIIQSGNVLPQRRLEEMDFYGQPLSETINDLQMFSFFENVWLKFEAPDEISHALSVVAEAAREISNSNAVHKSVEDAIKTLEDKIGASVNEFKWIGSIWTGLEAGAKKLRDRTEIGPSNQDNLFRELGLLRYGFPASSHPSIRDVLQELLRGERAERDVRVAVIAACYQGRDNPVKNINSLVMGVAVLLVTGMNSELLRLLNKTKPLSHFSLKVVFAEMLFKLNPKNARGIKLLEQLKKEYEETPPLSHKRGSVAVGIAYLLVRLWRVRGGYAVWRSFSDDNGPVQDELRELYLNDAVKYAHEAYTLLDHNPMKKVYALNQYLYYLVEGGGDDRIDDMAEAAMQLSNYKRQAELWQYRFDDTLARYLFRVATKAKNEDDWKDLIREAKWHIDEARKRSHGDPDIIELTTALGIRMSAGYHGTGYQG